MLNGLNHILEKWIGTGKSGTMDVDTDAFLDTLARSQYHGSDIEPRPVEPEKERPLRWWEIPYQKGVRFIAIAGITFLMATLVIHYAIIYINDILLHENQLHINSQGAFNPHKSMNCEYALYLFNTADLWANSGIQVNRKDLIKINISGGYNSAIEGDVISAQNNTELKYPWKYYDAAPDDTLRRKKKNHSWEKWRVKKYRENYRENYIFESCFLDVTLNFSWSCSISQMLKQVQHDISC